MAYYIIDKITNKINPNAITGEIALFKSIQDFLIAKKNWITDNTITTELPAFDENGKFLDGEEKYKYILKQELKTLPLEYETIDNIETIKPAPQGYEINKQKDGCIELPNPTNTKYIQITTPNENEYQYRPADHNEIKQYASDYLDFKKTKENRIDIVASFKSNPTIENTHRKNIEDYLQGQIQDEVFGIPYMYIEATGVLLNEFLANELIEKENNEKAILEKKKTALMAEIKKDMDSQKVRYLFFNSNKPTTDSQPLQTVAYEGLPLLEIYNAIQIKINSHDDIISIETLDLKYRFEVPSALLADANQTMSQINNNKNKIKTALQSALLHKCNTEQEFDKIENYYKQPNVQDGDDIKDSFITVKIDISKYKIKIYELPLRLEVLQKIKTLEETDITNTIFQKLI